MERCPNCRARWDGAEHCRRCGMALAPLIAIEQAAHRLVAGGVARLAAGDAQGAAGMLRRARTLRHEPLIDYLLAYAQGAAGAVKSS